ncbi:unnamed protein product [Angiostrongylus costaricensis]|uniref:C2H2-type domain-containing protein n=1 Tax=Angiostrongylus costaricensis TaxID=334426 RepID=A0A0R3PWK9_ANGCS|nr:unnamed protein product [Angiostrongylus costaricensis]
MSARVLAENIHDPFVDLICTTRRNPIFSVTLLKRRPYHRQAGAQSSIDHDSNGGGSTRASPGIRDHRMLQSSSRNQPHYEPLLNAKLAFGGSLTSGLPINRHIKQESLPTCSFCLLTFPNEAGLQVHEIRCSKKVEASNAETDKQHYVSLEN